MTDASSANVVHLFELIEVTMKQNSMKCLKDLDVERKKEIQSELVRLIESTSIFALLMSSHASVLSENIVLINLRLLMNENVDKRDREQRRFE